MEPSSSSRRSPIAELLVGALVLACFGATLGFGFVRWDDPIHLLENRAVLRPASVPLREHLLTPGLGYPIPLTVLTYQLEHALAGLRHPSVYHATNVLLHLGSTLLLLRLARRLGLSTLGASVAAGVFALHPAVAEPVAWISGRKELLAAMLSLSTMHLAMDRTRRGWSTLTFGLALLSKPVSAFVLAPLAYWLASSSAGPPGRRWRDAVLFLAPSASLLLLYVPLALLGQSAVGALVRPESALAWARNLWIALGFQLGILALVQETTAKYMFSPWPPRFDPWIHLAPLVAALLAAACVRFARPARRRIVAFGLVWAVAAYLPSSNLIPLVRFVADSYLYLPLVGIGLMCGAIVDPLYEALSASRRRLAHVVLGAAAICIGAVTLTSSLRFRNSAALWGHTFQRFPNSAPLCQNYAIALYETSGPREVLEVTDRCIARFGPEAFEKNRGIALLRLGRLDEANEWLQRGLARDPKDGIARYYLDVLRAQREGRPPPSLLVGP